MAPLKYELICAYSNMNLNMLDKGMAQTSNWSFEAKYIYLGNNMNNLCNCKNKFNIMQVFTRKYVHIIPFITNKTAIKFWLSACFCFYVEANISDCQFSIAVSTLWADILSDLVALPIKTTFYNIKKVKINSVCSFTWLLIFLYYLTRSEFSGLDYEFPMKHSSHNRVIPFQWELGQGLMLAWETLFYSFLYGRYFSTGSVGLTCTPSFQTSSAVEKEGVGTLAEELKKCEFMSWYCKKELCNFRQTCKRISDYQVSEEPGFMTYGERVRRSPVSVPCLGSRWSGCQATHPFLPIQREIQELCMVGLTVELRKLKYTQYLSWEFSK